MCAAAKMKSPQTPLQEMTLPQHGAHFNFFALENFPNALSEGSQQHSNSLCFLITLEGKLMFIHNRLLLKHPLEMAAVTNAAIQSPVRLSIREAMLNICSEEGKRCRAYRSGRTCSAEDGSLSIPQGSAFGPEDSRYYWKYSHSPSPGLQLRTMQIIYPAKPLQYEIFHRTIQ